MTDCAHRHGSEIAGVFPEDIEVLISAEKLRGTDFCVGAIDATRSSRARHGGPTGNSSTQSNYLTEPNSNQPAPSESCLSPRSSTDFTKTEVRPPKFLRGN